MRETVNKKGSVDEAKGIVDERGLSMEGPSLKGLVASTSNDDINGRGSWLLLCGHRSLLILQLLDRCYQHFDLSSKGNKLVLLR